MHHLVRLRSIALALGIATVAFSHNAAAAPNPCSLVTQSEAAQAMGTPSLPGKFEMGLTGAACRYYSPDHTKNVFIQIINAKLVNGAGMMGGRRLPGVGDKAYWLGGTVFLQRHANYVQVGLYLSSASMSRMDPGIVPLARLIASRL